MTPQEAFLGFAPSVVRLSFKDSFGKTTSSGSGFLSEGHLITNNHVFQGSGRTIEICQSQHLVDSKKISVRRSDFRSTLVSGSEENNQDFALLDVSGLVRELDAPRLSFGTKDQVYVGKPVAILGYPFDSPNLSMHLGSVSSIYRRRSATVFQVDASVNVSNSGGPLVDLETGKVIGIVSRKHTGLSQAFEELDKAIQTNLGIVQSSHQSGISASIAGVNPVEAFGASQNQIRRLLHEIKRSANVGIGIAFSLDDAVAEIQ